MSIDRLEMAKGLVSDVADELINRNPERNLESMLRRVEEASWLLGKEDLARGIRAEFTGYTAETCPDYRNAQCLLRWVDKSPPSLLKPGEPASYGIWIPLPEMVRACDSGFGWFDTGRTTLVSRGRIPTARVDLPPATLYEQVLIPASAIRAALDQIEQRLADNVLPLNRELRFGDIANERTPDDRANIENSLTEEEVSDPEVGMALNSASAPLDVFIAYAREDEKYLNDLHTYLSTLKREGLVSLWHDRRIEPGQDWEREIDNRISTYPIILLLISAYFMDSDYCYGKELKQAIERHERGDARVIPIICRDCEWKIESLRKLNALPRDGRPVTSWRPQSRAWLDVAEGIRRAAQTISRQSTYSGIASNGPNPLNLEAQVFSTIMEMIAAAGFTSWSIPMSDLFLRLSEADMSAPEAKDALRKLSDQLLLKAGLGAPVRLTPQGIETGLELIQPDYAEQKRQIQTMICRLHPVSAETVAEATSLPIEVVAHVFEVLETKHRLRRIIKRNHGQTMDPLPDFCPRPDGLQAKEHDVLRHLVRRVAVQPKAFQPKLLFWPGTSNERGYQSVPTREAPVPEGERSMLYLRQDVTGPLIRQGFLVPLGHDEFAMTPRLFQAYGYEMPG